MKSLAVQSLKIAAVLLLAGFSAGCGNGGDSSSTQTFPSSATVFYMHSVAFRNSTTMVAWGYNAFGQVGDNSTTQRTTPVTTGLVGMTGTSVGSNHSLAFMNNSTVRAWGYNGYGQLGNGDSKYESKTVPVKVADITGVTAVAAGGFHSLALIADGSIRAWGLNDNGQLGNNSTTKSNVPVSVTDSSNVTLTGFTKIAAGGSHSVARKSDNTVWTWGSNGYGQLGDGTITNSPTPVQVKKDASTYLSDVKLIAAGGAFTVAVDNSNNVWAWGYNGYGQVGLNPTSNSSSDFAVQVSGISGTIIAISAGADHVLAVTNDGKLWSWGLNRYYQLGDGSTTDRFTATEVTAIPIDISSTVDGVNPIAAIGLHSLARSGGKLKAWGYNANGQLGDGSTTNRSTPVAVSGY